MAKEIRIKVGVKSNVIPVKVGIGQTVERIVAPDTYTGPVTVTPTESEQVLQTKDKLLTDNVTVNPIQSEYIIPTGQIEITENGTYDVAQMATALVNVSAPQNVVTGSFVCDGSQDISLPCPFEADIFIMHNPEKLDGYTPASGNAIWAMVIAPFIAFSGRKSTAGALTSVASWVLPNTSNRPGLSYADGNVTVRLPLSNNNQMVVGRTYNYILVKLSE